MLLLEPKPACPRRFTVEGTSEELSLSFSAHLFNSLCLGKGKLEVRDEALFVLPWLCWARAVQHLCTIVVVFTSLFLRAGASHRLLGSFWLSQGFLPPTPEQRMTNCMFRARFTCRTRLHNCDDCGCLLSFAPLGRRSIYCRYMCYCRERCAILKMQILGTSGKFSSKLIAHQM